MQFFLHGWTGAGRPSSVDWCGVSLALAWSPKNREEFQIGRASGGGGKKCYQPLF